MQRQKPHSKHQDAAQDEDAHEAPKGHAMVEKAEAETQEVQSKSRKLLAATASTPAWLQELFPLGSDVVLMHVEHRNHNLPHFQARFSNNLRHAGKLLDCIQSSIFNQQIHSDGSLT